MVDCDCEIETADLAESKILIALLIINGFMFFAEILFGILSESTALIADSLDMLADASVYGIALYAVGKSALDKIRAAHTSGIFQVVLGTSVFLEALRRWIWGSDPESVFMILVGIVALMANVACLIIISRQKSGEVHLRASYIFSKNDVIANLGIIVGGILVFVLESRFPDLVIGIIISFIVVRGGMQIIKDAKNEKRLHL